MKLLSNRFYDKCASTAAANDAFIFLLMKGGLILLIERERSGHSRAVTEEVIFSRAEIQTGPPNGADREWSQLRY